jgi:glycosyltransferase involved in cell wall biosynthesis
MNNVVCIPAYKPDHRLLDLVEALENVGLIRIVLADDGSGSEYTPVFCRAEEMGCTIVHHAHNMGKGAALRTGIEKAVHQFGKDINVITADADGQHLAQDIVRIADAMDTYPDHLVLGVRDFDKENVPPKSRMGNRITSAFFKAATGVSCNDTQTGLRAVPAQFLEQFTEIEGERFEYETNMLLQMKRLGIRFVEQPIETVYDKEEYSSHYNALKDSWRIFKVMARFMAHKR